MSNLRSTLEANLIGQEQFIAPVLNAVTRYTNNLHWSPRPVGSYMLMGPTGVGKSRACEVVAEALNGDAKKMVTIHCAEFQLSHEVAKILGAPPGYLGHRESPPRLSQEALKAARADDRNLAVVLFDEIEKAHPDLFKLCLGILEKGTLTMGDNKVDDFQRTMVFFTTNLGAKVKRKGSIAFEQPPALRAEAVPTALKGFFSPEFLNRIDKFLVFNDLRREDLARIIGIYVKEANDQFATRVQGSTLLRLVVSSGAEDLLIDLGYSNEFGARELRRVWERDVLTPLASYVGECAGSTREWPVLRLDSAGGNFEFTPLSMSESLAASFPPPPDPPMIDIFQAFGPGSEWGKRKRRAGR
jgi:ATP-dependent Clp protease ATP-binding subunit ClpA